VERGARVLRKGHLHGIDPVVEAGDEVPEAFFGLFRPAAQALGYPLDTVPAFLEEPGEALVELGGRRSGEDEVARHRLLRAVTLTRGPEEGHLAASAAPSITIPIFVATFVLTAVFVRVVALVTVALTASASFVGPRDWGRESAEKKARQDEVKQGSHPHSNIFGLPHPATEYES
jgi:uncharacterized membrane protein YphA (DoxX/SURF4 family)